MAHPIRVLTNAFQQSNVERNIFVPSKKEHVCGVVPKRVSTPQQLMGTGGFEPPSLTPEARILPSYTTSPIDSIYFFKQLALNIIFLTANY